MSRQDDIAEKAVRKSTLKSLKSKKRSRLKQLKIDYENAVQQINIQYAEDPERLKAKYAAAEYAKSERAKKRAERRIENEKRLLELSKKTRRLTVGEEIGSSIVQKLDIKPIFSGADIKLCISNSNEKKIITLCPATDGDDNVNKWQYITNGDKYKLILEINDKTFNNIEYPLKITGGSEGSSDPEDFTKTTFQPSTIEIVAGEEGQTIMTINTADGIRKNYWYPNPSEKIKVEFDKDKDTCSYKVEYGDLPGKYAIKVMCTKSNDNNAISVTVDSNKINTKVKVIVKSGPAYYLEVEEPDKFTVSSDKYTWKTNPTNDDTISFLFKLKDKYLNYITTSVIGKGEITITSETFGSSKPSEAI